MISGTVPGALNAATYLDMALRGRPASDSPPQLSGVVTYPVLRTGAA